MYITLLKIAAPVVLFCAYTWFIYDAGKDSVRGDNIKSSLSNAVSVRAVEHDIQDKSNQVNKDAQIQLDRLQTDLDAAGDTIERLRDEAERYAKRVPSCPRAANSSPTTNGPAVVLSKLLSGCEQRAAQLAQAVDESRIAGLACESAYDSLAVYH